LLKPSGFSDSLNEMSTTVSEEITLASISQAEGQIQISGSAKTHESILSYVVALQSSGALANPSVSLTEGSTQENPIAFKIAAVR
jgi:Tfp pilus assembly protein PilN